MGGRAEHVAPQVPPRGRSVPRPRVAALLDTTPVPAALLVVGPAGTGKTTVVAAYAERARAAGSEVSWLPADQHEVLAAAVADAAGRAEPPVLVVDDAHRLCEEGIATLVEALTARPEAMRLVLVSRRDLSWIPVGAVLAGHVRALPVDALRLDDTEAAALVRLHLPSAGPDEVAAVVDQAAGWAAALVLGAGTLGAAGDVADPRAALTATRRPLLDYLEAEVVAGLEPDLLQVLLTTCRLGEVTADEAVLLSGIAAAGAQLDRAAAAGLFVTGRRADRPGSDPDSDPDSDPSAATHGWRYHPLLVDLLRRRTDPGGPDAALAAVAHQRAVAALVDQGDAERSLRLARLSGDVDLQLQVIRAFAADMVLRRRPEIVATALGAIPLEVRNQHRELLVLHAAVLRAHGDVEAAKAAADRALAHDADGGGAPLPRDVEAELAALELWQARFGWRAAEPAIARAEAVLRCRHIGTASAHDLRDLSPLRAHWLALELAAFQIWLGDLQLASIHLQDAAMYTRRVDLPALDRATLTQRALLEMVTGAYQSARSSADAALAIDPVPRHTDLTDVRAHLVRGWSHVHALELEEAQVSLALFEATPAEMRDPLLLVYGRLLRACVLAATGQLAEALRLLDQRGDVPEHLPPHIRRDQQMVRLLLQVTVGDLSGIERTAREMRALDLTPTATLADALHAGLTGREARALGLLDEIDPAGLDGLPALSLSVAVARTALLHRTATPSGLATARAAVPDLLTRAAPQRLLSTIAMGELISPGFLELLAPYAQGADAPSFAVEAYAVLRGRHRPYAELHPHRSLGAADHLHGAAGDPATALTRREREVLAQLALGGGNADLARALFVSENTVKTHLASIYRKLSVDRRVDALRVARARRLI